MECGVGDANPSHDDGDKDQSLEASHYPHCSHGGGGDGEATVHCRHGVGVEMDHAASWSRLEELSAFTTWSSLKILD